MIAEIPSETLIYEMDSDHQDDHRVTFNHDEKKNEQETEISEIRSVEKVSPTNVVYVKPTQNDHSIVEYEDLDSPVKLRKSSSGFVFKQNESSPELSFSKLPSELQINETDRQFDLRKSQSSKQMKREVIDVSDEDSLSYEQQEEEQVMGSNGKSKNRDLRILTSNQKQMLVEANVNDLVMNAVPKGYKISCFVNVNSKYLGLVTQFDMVMKGKAEQNLISAKKEHFSLYSSFILSPNSQYITKRDNRFLGSLTSNFTGTTYCLYKNVVSPKSSFEEAHDQEMTNCIEFNQNVFGQSGIRKVRVSRLSEKLTPKERSKTCFEEVLEMNERSKIQTLQNQSPKLVKGKYKLDFHGKARVASGKNIILNDKTTKNEIFLMAKQSGTQYLVEVSHPLSIFQAFGICLANLDSKLLVK